MSMLCIRRGHAWAPELEAATGNDNNMKRLTNKLNADKGRLGLGPRVFLAASLVGGTAATAVAGASMMFVLISIA